jgi:hypothetical protein
VRPKHQVPQREPIEELAKFQSRSSHPRAALTAQHARAVAGPVRSCRPTGCTLAAGGAARCSMTGANAHADKEAPPPGISATTKTPISALRRGDWPTLLTTSETMVHGRGTFHGTGQARATAGPIPCATGPSLFRGGRVSIDERIGQDSGKRSWRSWRPLPQPVLSPPALRLGWPQREPSLLQSSPWLRFRPPLRRQNSEGRQPCVPASAQDRKRQGRAS